MLTSIATTQERPLVGHRDLRNDSRNDLRGHLIEMRSAEAAGTISCGSELQDTYPVVGRIARGFLPAVRSNAFRPMWPCLGGHGFFFQEELFFGKETQDAGREVREM